MNHNNFEGTNKNYFNESRANGRVVDINSNINDNTLYLNNK